MTAPRSVVWTLIAAGLAACSGGVDASHDADAVSATDAVDATGMFDAPADVVMADRGASDGGSGTDVTADVSDATPGDASCHLPVPADDSASAQRTACHFTAGAHVATTVTDPGTITAARAAVQHIFIIMQENHSLDTYFGHTGHGIEGVPAGYSNTDSTGTVVTPHHFATSCPCDIPHSIPDVTAEWDNGMMDGFARRDGRGALGYYDDADHPFYTWLITTFATSDRYFCALLGNTGPNRDYFYQASIVSGSRTIFDEMNSAGVNWGDYVAGYQLSTNGSTLVNGNNLEDTYGHSFMLSHTHPLSELMTGLSSGTLPPVVYIDVGPDEHPSGNIHDGERAVRGIVTALFASPLWAHSVLFLTYDEAGGFFDHVPPPSSCIATSNAADAPFDHYGIRVPLFVVSPFARPAYVSHRTHSHTSVLRFIEMIHDLPALTARDANADAMLDLFDFGCPSFAAAPAPIPDAGTPTGACSACAQ